ncbi:MAG: alpha/beta fold hydrolase [Acidimicrobiales bacterium]
MAGHGNPVLLLHGFTTSADRTWREPGWIDLLTEAGREVIALDLLGHGRADKPHDPAAYDRIEELILAELPDDRPVDGIGYSAGARILLTLASRHPDRFGRLVVGGVGANLFETRTTNPILDALQGKADPDDRVAAHFVAMAGDDGNDPRALAAFLQRTSPSLGTAELARVTHPTLVVIGSDDFAGPGDPLAEALPDAELVTLPGVDHFGLPKAFPFLERGLDHLGAAPF